MDSELWKLSAPWWQFILRGLVVFGFVLAFLRLSGKRQIGQMTPFDLVLLLLISNAVQNSMNGGDNSITAGIILAATVIGANMGLGWLTRRSRKVEVLVEGQAELLVHNGKVREDALQRANITQHDLLAAIREADCANITEVHAAILDTDGRISVLTRKGR